MMAQDTESAAQNATATTVPGVSDSDFEEAVASPSSFSVDGLTQSNRSLSELIAADKYLRKRARAGRRRHPLSGVGIAHGIPPGPCDR